MKFKHLLLISISVNWLLNGCKTTPVQTPTNQILELTPVVSTSTDLQQNPETVTSVPTLYSEDVNKITLEEFEIIPNCAAPCFWGIAPNKTKVDEAKTILATLGLQITENNTIQVSVDDVMSILISLDVNDNLVSSINVSINVENNSHKTARSWFAYSPESLVAQYGTPSKVEVVGSYVMDKVVFSESSKWYSMNIYFAKQDLIVNYEDGEFESKSSPYLACPLINKFRYVKLWFGENPKYPPPLTYSLDEVSNLNLSGFTNLMGAKKDRACFELDEKIFN